MMPVVRFSGVSKQYHLGLTRTSLLKVLGNALQPKTRPAADNQILWALRDVSFELARGESLALIGKNGAGKSTILKLLANITRPTHGDIGVSGRVSALIELGSGFHPDLTGGENIFLNGMILGLSRSDMLRRYDEIVAFSEIEQFIDTPVKRYSSGMLVRLGYAVASCIEPEILLVDEVLAVGDASFRQKCLAHIKGLIAKGTSLIFVSHNVNMVEAVCSSALYLKSGQIVFAGGTKETIEAYEQDLHAERAHKHRSMWHAEPASDLTDVRITRVEILDGTGACVDRLRSDQPAEVRVHYDSRSPIGRADVVLRIVRSDGLTCCMLRTSIDQALITIETGQGYVSAVLEPLQLIGGVYFVNAYINTAKDLVRLANKQSEWFHVTGSPLSFEEQSGVFEPLRRWAHQAGTVHAMVVNNGTGNPG